MRDIENGVVVSAEACNFGCGWEDPYVECACCGADITNETQYKDFFEYTVCRECFMAQFDEEDE